MTQGWDVEIAYIIRHSEASVRLSNVIQRLASTEEMPINTIGEYVQLGARANESFYNIRGMGRNTLDELDRLLKSYAEKLNQTENNYGSTNSNNSKPVLDALSNRFDRINMRDLVLRHDLSVRTQNFYKHEGFLKMDGSIVSLGGYLKDQKRAHRLMKQYPNVGQKTCDEVHTFVGKWLERILLDLCDTKDDASLVHKIIYDRNILVLDPSVLQKLINQIEQFDFDQQTTPIHASADEGDGLDWDEVLFSNIPAEEKTLKIISAILDDRDFEITVLRHGLGGKKFTLQTLGDKYEITRERVRQIEARAMKKLRIPTYITLLESVLLEREEILTQTLFRSSSILSVKALSFVKKDVHANDLFLIKMTYESLKDWLSAKFIAHSDGNNIVSWSKEDALDADHLEVNSGLGPMHVELLNKILELPWPASLNDLHAEFPGCPPTLIEEILDDKYKVKFADGYISSIENLPMRHRLVIVLKRVGRGLHTSEIVAHHTKMFGIATNEHAVGAVLMRLDEALITARGVYDLYENLAFTETDLSEIRDTVFSELKLENTFISSKKLFEKLFASNLDAYPERLSDYMLHGIIQDDTRFDVRRGLMVGLNTDEYDGQFKSLQEEIWELIDNNGPISIRDIHEGLSATRQILDSTIEVSINSMPDVFANESKTYDKVERVFGSVEAYEILVQAVYVNLLRGPLSLFALQTKLSSVSQDFNERTLRSVLNSIPNINYTGKIVTLVNVPEKLSVYADYIKSESSKEVPELLMQYNKLDASYGTASNLKNKQSDGVFNSILSEFEF